MDEDVNNKRCVKLGFKPQRENAYNKLLPYADEIDEESLKLLADIKTNLIKSVLAREMRPGCALWTSRLNKYVKIYGMKFSKEDHVAFIKLFYELMTIPDLEPTRINKCASTLTLLLKKRYLLSRDDLQLEWRPLYDLCKRTMEKSKTDIGMYRYFSTFESTLFGVIRLSSYYFPASATQEILDEFRPKMCPFSAYLSDVMQLLEVFLPKCVKPEEAVIGYKLWFEEFMTFWDVCHNASSWENNMMWLMAWTCRYNMGLINWEPYIPSMFVRFTRSMSLPVIFKQKYIPKLHKIDVTPIAIWICHTLNGDKNSAFFHLEKFMQMLESYYHSANMGRWTQRLRDFLKKLIYYFVQRVHLERFKKKSWDFTAPDDCKLTDDDITRFVNIMKPCVEQAMFYKIGTQDISLILQYLASLRPSIIVPMTLDKLYVSMDSLTEPHKLTSSMMGVIAVGRYMVQGAKNNYPEGPTHIIPLLMALLPGIDPNDIRKSYVTFNFIIHFVNMIPLIDSSEAHKYHELTEEEHIICESTARFEDFVLQLIDKLCTWVDSSSLDFVRLEQVANNVNSNKNRSETIAEIALASIVAVVMSQSSPGIFKSALKKVYNFATSRVLEVTVSGKMVAVMLHAFAKVNPKETLKLFIPYLCDTIEKLLDENPNIINEEQISDELIYYLLILSEIVDGRSELLNYMDRLMNILDRTLHMTNVSSSQISARMLELIMTSLTYSQAINTRSSTVDFGTHVKDFLPIREWGKPENVHNLKMDWYVPGDNEIACVQNLLDKYLTPELEKLDNYSKGESVLVRRELKSSLKIIISILSCQPVLPIWDEPAFQLVDSVLEPWAFNLKVSSARTIAMPDGKNVRKTIADTLHNLQKKLLEVDEGDTQSLNNIISIYNILLFNKSRGQDFEFHWKNFHISKKLLEDRLHQNKCHLRHVLIDRVVLQQEFRNESRYCSFTETHKQILLALFELSVSSYSEVRMAAQAKLYAVISYFPYSYTVLMPKIKEILQLDSTLYHEKFKGCLYVLIGPKNSPIVARHDWEFIRDLWPLIIRSTPSEKPSIVNLISALNDAVNRFFPTIAIKLIIPESCLTAATKLATNNPHCDLDNVQSITVKSEDNLRQASERRRIAYEATMDSLLNALKSGNLHWRYFSMAVSFLKCLVHFDVKYNSHVVKFFLEALIHDAITIRKLAIKVFVYVAIQNKPEFKKIEINPFTTSITNPTKDLQPGVRPDNEWLLYNSNTVPKTAKEWDEPRFVHEQQIGYYAWPKRLMVFAPSSEQPSTAKRMNNLNDTEKEIYNFFSNEHNLKQLVTYLSMEERKGQDQFNCFRFLAFKNLFKMFEDSLLPFFIPHLERLINDKHESSQRCAVEIISAIIRGSKHWSFEKVESLWSLLIPIIQAGMANMNNEVLTDWSLCVSMALESRDPNRSYWLLELLMDDPLKDQTSFIASARLHILFNGISQYSWRSAELIHRMLEYFRNHLSHPFQNIREKISTCLALIFSKDVAFPNGAATPGPRVVDFFKEVAPKLDNLYKITLSKMHNNKSNDVDNTCDNLGLISLQTDEEKENNLRLFKVVGKYITMSVQRASFSTLPEYLEVLPLACALLNNNDTDEEISTIATNLLVNISQAMIMRQYIPNVIDAVKKVVACPLWSSRAVITEFFPVFIFHNMASVQSNTDWVLEVQQIVLELLEDVQPEIRVSAAKALSGLLHCQFIPDPVALLNTFKQKARTKLKRKDKAAGPNVDNMLRYRHAGVLGLCAFINAHPYDIPDCLPDVFSMLGPHLSDPQPIPATIRKTLGDFKRTHHDNWEIHKLKFTEDELCVLSDLTVPPSYYV